MLRVFFFVALPLVPFIIPRIGRKIGCGRGGWSKVLLRCIVCKEQPATSMQIRSAIFLTQNHFPHSTRTAQRTRTQSQQQILWFFRRRQLGLLHVFMLFQRRENCECAYGVRITCAGPSYPTWTTKLNENSIKRIIILAFIFALVLVFPLLPLLLLASEWKS